MTEDYETRLREFDTLMQMTQEATGAELFQQMVALQDKYKSLEDLFEKIDRLEAMVAKIKMNMDAVDSQLVKAEATVVTTAQERSSKVMPSIVVRYTPIFIRIFGKNEAQILISVAQNSMASSKLKLFKSSNEN